MNTLEVPQVTSEQQMLRITMSKVNEIVEFLNQKSKSATVCEHTNFYQMKPNLFRCKDCKKIFKR